MALTESSTIAITVTPLGEIEVCTVTTILRDGAPIVSPPTTHWDVYAPGADVSGTDPRVVAIAGAAWTPDVLAAWQAAVAAAEEARAAARAAARESVA